MKAQELKIKMKRHHASGRIIDDKVVYTLRQHYRRDLAVERILSKLSNKQMYDIIDEIDIAKRKLAKLNFFNNDHDSNKLIVILKSISPLSINLINILEEFSPTSAGRVLTKGFGFRIIQEFILEKIQRRELIKIYGPIKARRMFKHVFHNEIITKYEK
jgi:hypothetical protein